MANVAVCPNPSPSSIDSDNPIISCGGQCIVGIHTMRWLAKQRDYFPNPGGCCHHRQFGIYRYMDWEQLREMRQVSSHGSENPIILEAFVSGERNTPGPKWANIGDTGAMFFKTFISAKKHATCMTLVSARIQEEEPGVDAQKRADIFHRWVVDMIN
ncbi:hypothetical protein BJ165DRAFT_1399441 [Panaeolus papilionaceus]|nr:hypothetical protein BJ165DRAFT_1399441 [Panaeolus papilionaceus]